MVSLMHDGAAYFDAFWREACVGRDIVPYLDDCFVEDEYWYRLLGDPITTDDGIIFRYEALKRTDGEPEDKAYEGAEVLAIRDGKILTVSDYYCDPDPAALLEIASLSMSRHGESKYAVSGLGAVKYLRITEQLNDLLEKEGSALDATSTGAQLALRLDCSVEHLFRVLEVKTEAGLNDYIQRRLKENAGT